MVADTTSLDYWLNWRFLLCATWALIAMVVAAVIIWKYEGLIMSKTQRRGDVHESVGCLNREDTWRTCSKAIHPAWLLALRMIAFVVLLALLLVDIFVDGVGLFYFYTVWTFTLVTIYFGIGSLFSIYGCFYRCNEVDDDRADFVGLDSERGSYVAPALEGSANIVNMPISLVSQEEPHDGEESRECKTAGIWCYVFQVVFQISAGAVMLTDSVFWFVLYPFFTAKDHELSFGALLCIVICSRLRTDLEVCMHTLNAVFLCGDIILNRLRFPLFRIAYFVQFTCIFVVFQWTIHACVSMWWPYAFLDLSYPSAPIWYLAIGLVHLPCYAIILLIVRTKQVCLSRISEH